MARTPERSAAHLGEQLELYRRMWVLRLLDMALEESRIDGLLNGPMVAAFGQEAVAVGTIAALRPGDIMSTAIRHFEHAERVGRALPLGPAIAEMIAPARLRPAVCRKARSRPNGSRSSPLRTHCGNRSCSRSATPMRSRWPVEARSRCASSGTTP